jgi:hypothetical protein
VDQSDQHHLGLAVADAAQSSAAIDDPQTCAKPSPFITGPYVTKEKRGPRIRRAKDTSKYRALIVHTERNVPADQEPWTHVHAANVRALGPRGAIVFDYVAQWSRTNRKGEAQLKVRDCHGGYWLAASFEQIERQTGLTKHDAEVGIRACIDAGMIETTVMEYAGERCLHLRVAPGNGMQDVPWPLVVGGVTGLPVDPQVAGVKPAEPLKNGSQASPLTLLTELNQPADFPITTAIPTTEMKSTTGFPESGNASGQGQCAPENLAGVSGQDNPKAVSPELLDMTPVFGILETEPEVPALAQETPPETPVEALATSVAAETPEPLVDVPTVYSHEIDPDDFVEYSPEDEATLNAMREQQAELNRMAVEAKNRPVTAAVHMPQSHKWGVKNAGKTPTGLAPCNVFQHGKGPKTSQIAGKMSC